MQFANLAKYHQIVSASDCSLEDNSKVFRCLNCQKSVDFDGSGFTHQLGEPSSKSAHVCRIKINQYSEAYRERLNDKSRNFRAQLFKKRLWEMITNHHPNLELRNSKLWEQEIAGFKKELHRQGFWPKYSQLYQDFSVAFNQEKELSSEFIAKIMNEFRTGANKINLHESLECQKVIRSNLKDVASSLKTHLDLRMHQMISEEVATYLRTPQGEIVRKKLFFLALEQILLTPAIQKAMIESKSNFPSLSDDQALLSGVFTSILRYIAETPWADVFDSEALSVEPSSDLQL